jgi:hypothetical protein
MKLPQPTPYSWYLGAPVTVLTDNSGALFIGGNTFGNNRPFAFRIFKFADNAITELPLAEFATGRGILSLDPRTGQGTYSVTDDNSKSVFFGIIPGFMPIPLNGGTVNVTVLDADVSAVQNKLNQAIAQLAALTAQTNKIDKDLQTHAKGVHMNEASVYTIADIVVRDWWEKTGRHVDWQQALNAQAASLQDAANGNNPAVAQLVKTIAGEITSDPEQLTKAVMRKLGELLIEMSK